MLKLNKIIIGNIKKDPLRNIIMIAFVGISVFLMNISLSRFMHQEHINNLVREYGLYENYMYSAPPRKDAFNDAQIELARKNINSELDKMKITGDIEDFFSIQGFSAPILGDDKDVADYVFYPKTLAKNLKFPVSNGKSFSEFNFDGEAIPIIIGNKLSRIFKIGDIVSLDYVAGKCVVIGILERKALIPTTRTGGNGVNLNHIFRNADNAIVVCGDSDVDIQSGLIIKVANEQRSAVLERIGDITFVFTFEALSDGALEANRLNTEMQTIVFVLMSVVCITGVSSGNLLATISCKKKYATYFLCGMDWKTGVLTTFIESLIKLVVPAAVGYAMFYKWCLDQDFWGLRVTNVNLVLTIIFLVVVFLLTSLKPLLDIKHTSPVRIIVEM